MKTVMLGGLAVAAAFFAGRPAAAATLCVDPAGTGGCLRTIAAAVAGAADSDTIRVHAGTYKEAVTITKPLSLLGAGADHTVINATGRSNGIYIDGIDTPGLARVAVSGFTVEKAQFEGILVANATDVTLLDNRVLNNDQALVITGGDGSCTGQPAFETLEGDDCGEGIHLLGATRVIVVGNFVHGNAGGILISDDTGATHDNIIRGNRVSDNIYDCGITMASHPPAAITGAKASLGVYENTVIDNIVTKNGTSPPGGAGVGFFASVPGAAAYANVAYGNTITGNGIPGVAMHSHTPGQNLTNNQIIGNFISGNGPDTGDAATSGPTGINVYAVSPATGTVIIGNVIGGESIDIAVKTANLVPAHLNEFDGKGIGLANLGTGSVNATLNWWGCAGGPGHAGCSGVTGSRVFSTPVLTAP